MKQLCRSKGLQSETCEWKQPSAARLDAEGKASSGPFWTDCAAVAAAAAVVVVGWTCHPKARLAQQWKEAADGVTRWGLQPVLLSPITPQPLSPRAQHSCSGWCCQTWCQSDFYRHILKNAAVFWLMLVSFSLKNHWSRFPVDQLGVNGDQFDVLLCDPASWRLSVVVPSQFVVAQPEVKTAAPPVWFK